MNELAWGPEREYFRPNFFPNTADILNAYLVHGGPAAFYTRFVLAATLGPTYGIYSGFEHYENVPVREGSEEYLDSEKYEAKERLLDGPLLPIVGRLNAIRRAEPASPGSTRSAARTRRSSTSRTSPGSRRTTTS